MSQWAPLTHSDDLHLNSSSRSSSNESLNLDTTVVSHMLQLSGLTADMIAQSVHENRFDHVYAIYNLLVDKLNKKRKEQQRLQHHASLAYSRTRKASITTGIVERSPDFLKLEPDRLSPLTNSTASFNLLAASELSDQSSDLEKYDVDSDSNATRAASDVPENLSQSSSNSHPNTRRHTVGPGDSAHEQAMNCPVAPISFKLGVENGTNIPMNLPMMQNQPLHNLTIKDQHLLKPPTVMGATGAFGRRASDGGANLHIYYPATSNTIPPVENMFSNPNSRECLRITGNTNCTSPATTVSGCTRPENLCDQIIEIPHYDVNDESNDEIQRYMQSRGCLKRHTVGCTDDLSAQANSANNSMDTNLSHSPAPSTSSGRTRRTGLLTVMERPPGMLFLIYFIFKLNFSCTPFYAWCFRCFSMNLFFKSF